MIDDVITDPERLAALGKTGLLDTPSDDAFNQLARLAMRLTDAPIALISLVDAERQFFHTCIGSFGDICEGGQTPVQHSFCQYAVATREPFIIEDARKHPLLKDNPAVTEFGVIAYAGIPIIIADGHAIGSLCVLDSKPRAWRTQDIETLKSLAQAVTSSIGLRERAQIGGLVVDTASGHSAKDLELEDIVGDLLAALDSYSQLLAGSEGEEATLADEAALQEEIVRTEAALNRLCERVIDFDGLSMDHRRLLEAAMAYGDAKRRRSHAAQDFQQLRVTLSEVEAAGRASLDSELNLRREWRLLMPD